MFVAKRCFPSHVKVGFCLLACNARSPYQSVDIRDELLLLTDLSEHDIKDRIYECSNEIYGEVGY